MAEPAIVEWTLTNPRAPKEARTRTYEQAELSLAGEARLLGLARTVGQALSSEEVDLNRLAIMFDRGDIDWDLVLEMLGMLSEVMPDALAEFALICFGIFPSDEHHQRNDRWEDEREFLKEALNLSKVAAIMQTFAAQNDYVRLARPFWDRLIQRGQQAQNPAATSQPPTATSSKRATARRKSKSTEG